MDQAQNFDFQAFLDQSNAKLKIADDAITNSETAQKASNAKTDAIIAKNDSDNEAIDRDIEIISNELDKAFLELVTS